MKKIQQKISENTVLEKFVGEKMGKEMRESFAGLYSLSEETEEVKEMITKAIQNKNDYVLKPQREGGGNNLYGDEMVEKLKTGGSDLKAFILMSLIKPRPFTGFLLKESQYSESLCSSELGIYSVFLHDGSQILLNKDAGFLFRTKKCCVMESGVAAGFGHLDSPYLID